jgi:transposase-like protein
MSFRCKCGSSDFHTFFHYVPIDKERFRCLKCRKTYQRDGKDYKEIDLKKMWDESLIHK